VREVSTLMAVAVLVLPAGAVAQDVTPRTSGPRIHAGEGLPGPISELRGGPIWSDPNAKESSFAMNGEVLFVNPLPAQWTADIERPWRWLLEPRPHLGFTGNLGNKTSMGYFGLTWTTFVARDALRSGDGIRFDFYFGGSFNNGKHDANLPDRTDLGGNMLFRIGAELGYQFQPNWSVSLFLDHYSNGGLATRNQGLNSLGLRLGYAL
jgi:lipid A 3-O-deacylase